MIHLFAELIQLENCLVGVQDCVPVVVNYIFDINIPFLLPLTRDNLY